MGLLPDDVVWAGDGPPQKPPPGLPDDVIWSGPPQQPSPGQKRPPPGLPDDVIWVGSTQAQAPSKPGAFTRGFVSGMLEENPQTTAEALEGLSHIAPEQFGDTLRSGSQQLRDVAARSPQDYKRQAGSMWDVNSLDSALTWAGETIGQGVASSVPSLVTGVGGGVIGGRLGGRIGATVGALGGAAVPSLTMNYGEVYKALKDEGVDPKDAAQYAVYGAGPMAVLDTASIGPIVTRLGGLAEAKKEMARGIARRIISEGAKGVGREGLTESLQEMVKDATVSLAADKPFWTVEHAKGWAESGVGGGLTGGAMGGASGIRPDAVRTQPVPQSAVEVAAIPGTTVEVNGALVQPQQQSTIAPAPVAREALVAPTDQSAVLESYGYTPDQISGMAPLQRQAEYEQAIAANVTAQEPQNVIQPAAAPAQAAQTVEFNPPTQDIQPDPTQTAPFAEAAGNVVPRPDVATPAQVPASLPDASRQNVAPLLDIEQLFADPRTADEIRAAGAADEERTRAAVSDEPAPVLGTREAPVRLESPADVHVGAEQTAAEPTPAQADAGNYQKRHVKWRGLDISIETEAGGERVGLDAAGKPWSATSPVPYGYFKRTKGRDGDQVDVYIGPDPKSPKVFVVDQRNVDTLKHDEHKVMVGFRDEAAAREAYISAFSDNMGPHRIGAITEMGVVQFKRWLASGSTKPLAYTPPIEIKQRRKADRGPLSLFQFLATRGGIREDHGDLRHMGLHQLFIPGYGRLVRPDGMPLDRAREAAVEAGYLREHGDVTGGVGQSTVSDLLNALDAEHRGQKLYSEHDLAAVQERQAKEVATQRKQASAQMREVASAEDYNVTDDELKVAVDAYLAEGGDPQEHLVTAIEAGYYTASEELIAHAEENDTAAEDAGRAALAQTFASAESPAKPATERAPNRVEPAQDQRERGKAQDDVDSADAKIDALFEQSPHKDMIHPTQRPAYNEGARDAFADRASKPSSEQTTPNHAGIYDRGYGDARKAQRAAARGKPAQTDLTDTVRSKARFPGPSDSGAPFSLQSAPRGLEQADAGPVQRMSESDVATVRDIVKRVAGIDPEFADSIPIPKGDHGWGFAEEGRKAQGVYHPEGVFPHIPHDMIVIALDYGRPRAAFHEAFHRLQNKFLNDRERAVLRSEEGRLRDMLRQDEARSNSIDRMDTKEVQAETFAVYATNRDQERQTKGLNAIVARAFGRIYTTIRRLKNLLINRLGYQTSEDIFNAAKRGDIANRPLRGPKGESSFSLAPKQGNLFSQNQSATHAASKLRNLAERIFNPLKDVVRDLQMKTTPMAARDATIAARATAKDFANALRVSRWRWSNIDNLLKRSFKPEQLERMWSAADEKSVARQQGEHVDLSGLSSQESATVLMLQKAADSIWKQARALDMVKGERLPSYVPRMIIDMATGKPMHLGKEEGEVRSLMGLGANLRTRTAAETEAAAKAKFGSGATLVRNIRALPLATAKMEEAVAGRTLVNKIKEIGDAAGDPTVLEGVEPTNSTYRWFTIDHPALATWRPKFKKNQETGKVEVVRDQNDEAVFERVSIYVRSDFEGPLRSVLSRRDGPAYSTLMALKAKSMSVIMYSPAIHNMVEWSRALPSMPGKVITWKIYFEGNRAKNDIAIMEEAVHNGLVPIGNRAFNQDITSVAEDPFLLPGRSSTAKLLAVVPGLFDARAGNAVKRAVDKMGDVWHNTLLWDRVADLQMGLYINYRDRLVKQGTDSQSASRLAAHLANRYAGALPIESMSEMSRKFANVLLFSRSFTLGNIGAMKDVFVGLPRDVQAQIKRDIGEEGLGKIKNIARRRAAMILATDIALLYVMNSILQDVISYMLLGDSGDDIKKDYLRRFYSLLQRVKEHPFEALNPFGIMEKLGSTSENEPGKHDRILVGYQQDGTAIYARNPTGKIGEEFVGYATGPLDMISRKLGTLARPAWQTLANDKGFGRKVYNPNADMPSEWLHNIGNIAELFLESQLPMDQLRAARDLVKGEGDATTNKLKIFGPFAGVTFSKGAPGGPAMGELYRSSDEQRYRVQEALPDIRQMIRRGDMEGAVEKMIELKIPKDLMNFYIRTTVSPQSRMSSRKMRDFNMQNSEEDRERLNRTIERSNRQEPAAAP